MHTLPAVLPNTSKGGGPRAPDAWRDPGAAAARYGGGGGQYRGIQGRPAHLHGKGRLGQG